MYTRMTVDTEVGRWSLSRHVALRTGIVGRHWAWRGALSQFSAEDSQDYHDRRVRGCCTASLRDLVAGVHPPTDSSRPDRDLADLTSPSAWHRVKRCARSIGSELTQGHMFLAKLVETWNQSNGRRRSHLLSQWILRWFLQWQSLDPRRQWTPLLAKCVALR
jgi:hypothetical protein